MKTNTQIQDKVNKALNELIKEGLVEKVGDKYRLTEKGTIYQKLSVN